MFVAVGLAILGSWDFRNSDEEDLRDGHRCACALCVFVLWPDTGTRCTSIRMIVFVASSTYRRKLTKEDRGPVFLWLVLAKRILRTTACCIHCVLNAALYTSTFPQC